jgi:Uma2 family endonuclease
MSSAEVPQFITVDEYLAAEDQAQTKHEYIEGWMRAMTGATVRHNIIKSNCLIHLGRRLRGKPCRPFDSDMRLQIRHNQGVRFYYPDLQVICESSPQNAVYQDSPVLIIEVLSPSTRQYDLDEKMQAYLQISTLVCYIVLEQHQPQAIVMRRTEGGFLRECIEGMQSAIELPFLQCSLNLSDIYEDVEFTQFCVQESDAEYQTHLE